MKKVTIFSLLVVVIDQIFKFLIISCFDFGESTKIINNFFSLTLLGNTGAAFSTFSSNTILLILISIITLCLIYLFFLRNKILNNFECMVYGILIGGIFGNLIDRVFRGYVIDYLDFKIFGYDFPVFNFADSCIVVSIALIIIYMLKGDAYEDKS